MISKRIKKVIKKTVAPSKGGIIKTVNLEPCPYDRPFYYSVERNEMVYLDEDNVEIPCKAKLCQIPVEASSVIDKNRGIPFDIVNNIENYLELDSICLAMLDIILSLTNPAQTEYIDLSKWMNDLVWVLIRALKTYPFTTFLDEDIPRMKDLYNNYLKDGYDPEEWKEYYSNNIVFDEDLPLIKAIDLLHNKFPDTGEGIITIRTILLRYFHNLSIFSGKLSEEEADLYYPIDLEEETYLKYYKGNYVNLGGYAPSREIPYSLGPYKTGIYKTRNANREINASPERTEFFSLPYGEIDEACRVNNKFKELRNNKEVLRSYLTRNGLIDPNEFFQSYVDSYILTKFMLDEVLGDIIAPGGGTTLTHYINYIDDIPCSGIRAIADFIYERRLDPSIVFPIIDRDHTELEKFFSKAIKCDDYARENIDRFTALVNRLHREEGDLYTQQIWDEYNQHEEFVEARNSLSSSSLSSSSSSLSSSQTRKRISKRDR